MEAESCGLSEERRVASADASVEPSPAVGPALAPFLVIPELVSEVVLCVSLLPPLIYLNRSREWILSCSGDSP